MLELPEETHGECFIAFPHKHFEPLQTLHFHIESSVLKFTCDTIQRRSNRNQYLRLRFESFGIMELGKEYTTGYRLTNFSFIPPLIRVPSPLFLAFS